MDGRWEPANDVEQRLLVTAQAGQLAEMLGILLGAPLYLPGFADDGPGGGRRLLTRQLDGIPYLLAFTSVEAMQRAVEADGWRQVGLPELVRAWPELPHQPCGLALNPLTPVEVRLGPDLVPTLLPSTAALETFEPANETERLLRDALTSVDGVELLDVLVSAEVVAMTTGMDVNGAPVVPAFTSHQRYAEFLAKVPVASATVELDLVALLQQWPGEEYRLAVNPGTPIELWLGGDRLGALLAHATGLAERLRQTEASPYGTSGAHR